MPCDTHSFSIQDKDHFRLSSSFHSRISPISFINTLIIHLHTGILYCQSISSPYPYARHCHDHNRSQRSGHHHYDHGHHRHPLRQPLFTAKRSYPYRKHYSYFQPYVVVSCDLNSMTCTNMVQTTEQQSVQSLYLVVFRSMTRNTYGFAQELLRIHNNDSNCNGTGPISRKNLIGPRFSIGSSLSFPMPLQEFRNQLIAQWFKRFSSCGSHESCLQTDQIRLWQDLVVQEDSSGRWVLLDLTAFTQRRIEEDDHDKTRSKLLQHWDSVVDRNNAQRHMSQIVEDLLRMTTRKCVLTHGLYQVLGQACSDGNDFQAQASPVVNMMDLLKRLQAQDRSSYVIRMLQEAKSRHENKFKTVIPQDVIAPYRSMLDLFDNIQFSRVMSDSSSLMSDYDFKLVVVDLHGLGALTMELERGPASGHQDLLSSTLRRPRVKYFADLDLNRRAYRSRTAMQGEIALLMASWALVDDSSTVVDLFCGSCSLLHAACKMGARNTCGVDCDVLQFESAIHSDFVSAGYKRPMLIETNIFSPDYLKEIEKQIAPLSVDAIITDPPYNVHVGVTSGENDETREFGSDSWKTVQQRESESIECIFRLLDVARHILKPNGRLVFFVPDRTSQIDHDRHVNLNPKTTTPSLGNDPSGFYTVYSGPQNFSTSFRRWLIVLEKSA